MKKLSKQMCVVLVCVLGVLLAIFMLPTQVYAATEGDYTYSVTDGKASINGYKGPGGAVTIPSSLGGYPVTCIGMSSFQCSDLTTVTIPDSVVQIEDFAFMGSEELTNVYIGSGVTKLTAYAFDMCFATTGFFVDERNPNYSSDEAGFLYNKDKTELVIAPKTVSGTYRIADSVVVIRNRAFDDCNYLEHLIISDHVEKIGDYAFSGNEALSSVHFGSSVTTIGIGAFGGCKKLTDLVIPDSVTTIRYKAFNYCSGLTGTIVIPNGVSLIEEYTFEGCTALNGVILGEGTTEIKNCAFKGCNNVISVYLPDKLTQIGNSAFANCDNLKLIYFGGSQDRWDNMRRGYSNSALTSGTVRCDIQKGVPGDIDGNEMVDVEDVVTLLLHISMPEMFGITAMADFAFDGVEDVEDVVQLLLHVSMPEIFPLTQTPVA